MQGKRILITGGAGFIGSHLVESLVADGAEITVIDNLSSGNINNLDKVINEINFIKGDIEDISTFSKSFEDIDLIIHEAFPIGLNNRNLDNQYVSTAAVGTYNILKEACINDIPVIYGSSIAVYGIQNEWPIKEDAPLNPMIIYGTSKLIGEMYCRILSENYDLKCTILRYSDVYGPRYPRLSAPIAFLNQVMNNTPLQIFGGGHQVRSYTYIDDIVTATKLAIEKEVYSEIINISHTQGISIIELATMVNSLFSNEGISYLDGEKDERVYIFDTTKANDLLGFKASIDIETGLKKTYSWMKSSSEGEK